MLPIAEETGRLYQIQCESKKIPPGDLTFFLFFFHKRLRIRKRFLHTYYTFPSSLDYKFLFDYHRF